jgi:hypothetical protein
MHFSIYLSVNNGNQTSRQFSDREGRSKIRHLDRKAARCGTKNVVWKVRARIKVQSVLPEAWPARWHTRSSKVVVGSRRNIFVFFTRMEAKRFVTPVDCRTVCRLEANIYALSIAIKKKDSRQL